MVHGTRFLIIATTGISPLVFEIEKRIKRDRKNCWK
jgi:hypothetical protein